MTRRRPHSIKISEPRLATLGLWLGLALLCGGLAVTAPAHVRAQTVLPPETAPGEVVLVARQSLINGQYEACITQLTDAFGAHIDGESAGNLTADERIEALRVMAMAQLLKPDPDRDAARVLLEHILDLDSDFRFFTGMAPPEAENLLAEVRSARQENGGGPSNGAHKFQTIYVQKEVVERQYWVNLVPFGMGQLQNGDTGKGVFFLLTEVVALSTNMISFAVIEGLRGPDGLYTPENARAAESLRTAQYVSLASFIAIATWGVADAFYFYDARDVEIRTLDGPPPELSSSPRAPAFDVQVGANSGFLNLTFPF